jgi:hypothetical protein
MVNGVQEARIVRTRRPRNLKVINIKEDIGALKGHIGLPRLGIMKVIDVMEPSVFLRVIDA